MMNPQNRVQYRAAITPHGEVRLQRRPHPLMSAAVVLAVAGVASAGLWVAGVGPGPLFFLSFGGGLGVVFWALVIRTGEGLWEDVPAPAYATARAVHDVDPGIPMPSQRLGVTYRWRRVPRSRVDDLHEAAEAASVALNDHLRAQENAAQAAEARAWLNLAREQGRTTS